MVADVREILLEHHGPESINDMQGIRNDTSVDRLMLQEPSVRSQHRGSNTSD